MAVTQDRPAPYTAPSGILDVIRRYRNHGLTRPITLEVLTRAGVKESLAPRTLQSLIGLDLIGEDGNPTDSLEGLAKAPEAEFQSILASVVRNAYADVFSFVDPAKDDADRIRDAFRPYAPRGQQDRMVALFLGLCEASGIIAPNSPAKPKASKSSKAGIAARSSSGTTGGRKPKSKTTSLEMEGIPSPLLGLLQSLPKEGGWPQQRRDDFYKTFGAVLDFCYPIEEKKSDGKDNQ